MTEVHPRTHLANKAATQLRVAIATLLHEHKLTYFELVKILLEQASWWSAAGIKDEREKAARALEAAS